MAVWLFRAYVSFKSKQIRIKYVILKNTKVYFWILEFKNCACNDDLLDRIPSKYVKIKTGRKFTIDENFSIMNIPLFDRSKIIVGLLIFHLYI